eukprot:Sdes_comp10594_c0_seq1m2293
MMELVLPPDSLVLPGDVVSRMSEPDAPKPVKMGPGLFQDSDSLVASKAGILKVKSANRIYVDNNQKRYVALKDELIIGIIEERLGENYRVDIGASYSALLNGLAFEGATRKNRPILKVGDLVYCKLSLADRDMTPEVVCVSSTGKRDG